MKTMTDVKRIMDTYQTEEIWKTQSATDIGLYREFANNIKADAERCKEMVETLEKVLLSRQTLIQCNFGKITQEMVKNQKMWLDYIERVQTARSIAPRSLGWLELLVDDWVRRKDALEEFWGKHNKITMLLCQVC